MVYSSVRQNWCAVGFSLRVCGCFGGVCVCVRACVRACVFWGVCHHVSRRQDVIYSTVSLLPSLYSRVQHALRRSNEGTQLITEIATTQGGSAKSHQNQRYGKTNNQVMT